MVPPVLPIIDMLAPVVIQMTALTERRQIEKTVVVFVPVQVGHRKYYFGIWWKVVRSAPCGV